MTDKERQVEKLWAEHDISEAAASEQGYVDITVLKCHNCGKREDCRCGDEPAPLFI